MFDQGRICPHPIGYTLRDKVRRQIQFPIILPKNYLKNLLDATGDTVMFVTDDIGVHDTRGGVEGIHGGVDTTLSHGPVKKFFISCSQFQNKTEKMALIT
jgi:hypothetical protein